MIFPVTCCASPFQGAYMGVDLGPVFATSKYHTNPNCPSSSINAVFCNSSPDPTAANGNSVEDSGSGTFNLNGFNANLHGGYNFDFKISY